MTVRSTLGDSTLTARHNNARAYSEGFDGDQQLKLKCKKAHVYYSETHTDCEIWEPVGQCSVPLNQKEEEGQQQGKQGQQSSSGAGGQSQWNDKQPKGEAAEIVFSYMGGNRDHAIGLATDPRVKPYELSEGEGVTYAPDGSEQMLYFKDNGTYLVSLDNKSVKDKEKKTRYVSMRHVEKDMQSHKIEDAKQQGQSGGGGQAGAATLAAQGGQQQKKKKYPHEGKTINTEVRCTKDRIEFRAGDKVFGYFEKSSEKWHFNGKTKENDFSGDYTNKADKILQKPGSKHELEEGADVKVEGEQLFLSSKVYLKKSTLDVEGALVRSEQQLQQITQLEQRIAALEQRIAQLES